MPQIIENATCLACGCLCDDIRAEGDAGQVVGADRACLIGAAWFLAPRPGEGLPAATIDGRPVGFEVAVARAAEILRAARAPVVWGLAGTTIEAQRSALAIADAIGAVVDVAGSPDRAARLRAFQRVGQVSATLGEVKDRADVVVFWGVDPVTTHPRHFERYSVAPRGRFIPEGRSGRTIIAVDHKPTATAAASDLCVHVEPDRQGEALDALRAIVRAVAIDSDRAEASTGIPFPALLDLADRLTRARYGAFFFGTSPGGAWAVEGALKLVRDLNVGRRFVALELGEGGNAPGAASVLAWQGGAPSALDFGRGFPRHLPGDATLADRLGIAGVDAALLVADDPAAHLPPDLLARLGPIPTIRIAPGATSPALGSAVAFDVARPGIEAGGTVVRVDGVMLPLRPAIAAGVPTDREVLDAISRAILAPASRDAKL